MLDRFVFWPPIRRYRPETLAASASGMRLLQVRGSAGNLMALHHVNRRSRFTLLCSHGNAEQLSSLVPTISMLHDTGFSVLAYDYRGYGRSEGSPSEQGVYEDVACLYDYLTISAGVGSERIIACGWSLGAAVALELALRRQVAGLVLEAPFLSAPLAVLPGCQCRWDRFRNVDKIRLVHSPLLIIHGDCDEVVPIAHGRQLFQLASQPKRALWVEGAGHCNVFDVAPFQYREAQSFAGLLSSLNRHTTTAKEEIDRHKRGTANVRGAVRGRS